MNTVYVYDGSFRGFLTCVFRAFDSKEDPADVRTDDRTLLPVLRIETDDVKAARVGKWVRSLGGYAVEIVTRAFLSREVGADADVIRFLKLANARGADVTRDMCDPLVMKLTRLAKSVGRERARIVEFLRFSDYDGNLAAVVNPKYFVLPLIVRHFEQRFPNENYFIYDEVHGAALAHEKGGASEIFPLSSFTAARPTDEEKRFRTLWKLFYDTIEIKERRNHRLRMQHLPKRFWKNVTELADMVDN